MANTVYVRDLADLRMSDVGSVGGKSASLGELIGNLSAAGVRVPGAISVSSSLVGAPVGSLPVTVAVLVIEARSTSTCVTV